MYIFFVFSHFKQDIMDKKPDNDLLFSTKKLKSV